MQKWKLPILIYSAIVLISCWPIISVMLASSIANACNCQLDEASIHPCMILGMDFGNILYSMFVAGWFGLVTIPVGGLAFVGYTVYLLISFVKHNHHP